MSDHSLPRGAAAGGAHALLEPIAHGPHQRVFRVRYEGPPVPLHTYLVGRYCYGRSAEWVRTFYPARVRLNGQPVDDATRVVAGDEITYLHLRADEPPVPPLPTPLHEDAWLFALAKGDSAPVNPAGVYYFGCLAIQARETFALPELTPIHRLDLETSGLVLFARHKAQLATWHELFHRKLMRKRYRALVHGHVPETLREIAGYIVAHRESAIETRLRLVQDPPRAGAPGGSAQPERSLSRILACTHRTGPQGQPLSELELEPVTGKTNQLRVHLAHVGHPIVGDKKYHPDEEVFLDWHRHRDFARLAHLLLLPRQALHCEALAFPHPFTSAPIELTAPVAMWQAKVAPLLGPHGPVSQD